MRSQNGCPEILANLLYKKIMYLHTSTIQLTERGNLKAASQNRERIPRGILNSTIHHCNYYTTCDLLIVLFVLVSGISTPRVTSVTGVPLPSPRLISSTAHPDISHLHNRYTLMVMQLAQFIDHDLTFTPVQRG